MSESSTRNRRVLPVVLTAGLTAATAAAVLVGGTAVGAAAATPKPLTAAEIDAKVAPSLVQLQADWSGRVGVPMEDGTVAWSKPRDVAWSCTGWFVDTTGDIVSAGHCVDPQGRAAAMIDDYLAALAKDGTYGIDAQWVHDNSDWAHKHWQVQNAEGGSGLDRTLTVYQSNRVAHRSLTQPTTATLTDFRPFDDADVALMHVDVDHTHALPVADRNPAVGASVTTIGFPATVGEVSDDDTLQPSFKTGTVSSHQDKDGSGKLEINADMSPGMSGGPAIDSRGNVVGIVSYSPTAETKDFNFLSDTDSVRSFLTRQNIRFVAPFRGTVDTATVAKVHLFALLAAAAAVVVGALVLLLLLVVPRRRPSAPVDAATGPLPTAPLPTAPTGPVATFPTPTFPPAAVPAFQPMPVGSPLFAQSPLAAARCARGHISPVDARFCPECGSPVRRLEAQLV